MREDQVLRPDGQPGIYGVVHFKNRAVGVLPVDDDGTRLARRASTAIHSTPTRGRSPKAAAPSPRPPRTRRIRELREETGLVAGRIELVATSHLSNSVSDEIAYVFRATELTEGPSDPEGLRADRRPAGRVGRSLADARGAARSPTR